MRTNTYFCGIGPAGTGCMKSRGLDGAQHSAVMASATGRDDLPSAPVGARVLFLASDWVGEGREWHDALYVDDAGEWQRHDVGREAAKAWLHEVPVKEASE